MSQIRDYQKQLTLDDVSAERLAGLNQMSQKYVVFDTKKLVDALCDLKVKGLPFFEVREIKMRKMRQSTKAEIIGKGTHMVRVKTINPMQTKLGDKVFPELLILNSYDGSKSLQVEMGVFRLVCSNGLVVKTRDMGSARLRHMNTEEEVAIQLLKDFAENCKTFIQTQERLEAVTLTEAQYNELALQAARLRWPEATPELAERLLKVERQEDAGDDAWTKMNVIQEHLVGGGFKAGKKNARPVNRWQEDVRLNQGLFSLTMEMAGLVEDAQVENDSEAIAMTAAINENPEVLDVLLQSAARTYQERAPAKRIRKTIGGVRQYVDNPEWFAWQERQFVGEDLVAV